MIPHQPPWMDRAWQWLGIQEALAPGASNPEIEAFHRSIDGDSLSDDIAWCSSAVNALMESCGIFGTDSRAARSWLLWGEDLGDIPAYGCVCVLWRSSPDSWMGHVGIFLGFVGDDVLLWGGNQRNEVSVRRYSKDRVLGYRWPSGGERT